MEKTGNELHPKEAIKILTENLQKIDRVNEWADEMGYQSMKKFSRVFRNYYGERPARILLKTKVGEARQLLKSTDKSHYEIAQHIGKRDEQALYHFMKKQTGKPPSFFRNNHEEKVETE